MRKVASANLQTAYALLIKKTSGRSDEAQIKALLTNCVDSVALLGHIHNGISTMRRSRIRSFLKAQYATICNSDEVHSPLLFGDELAKRLRDAKETSKLSQVFTRPSKPNNQFQHRSYDNNWQKAGNRSNKSYNQ